MKYVNEIYKTEDKKPFFYHDEFQDYLFRAIQDARGLTVEDVSNSDDVLRSLKLAIRNVEVFLNLANNYYFTTQNTNNNGRSN